MNARILAALFAAGGVAYACVPRSHSSAEASSPSAGKSPGLATAAHALEGKRGAGRRSSSRQHVTTPAAVAASFVVKVDRDVHFALNIRNTGERRLELAFPSGQTHEIVVLDAAGREVWRWSEGRLFTQALQNRFVGGNESVSFEESWSPGAAHRGTFTAVATLRSQNFPVEQRAEFTLP